MREKKIYTILFLMLIYVVFLFSPKVFASTLDFSVDAKIPTNQIDTNVSYFDLLVKPGEKEDIKVLVTNNTNETIKLNIEPTTAVTNENGIIDYSQTSPVLDLNIKQPFHLLVDKIPITILKGNEQKEISIPINIPKEPFDGNILGALKFSQADNFEKKTSGKIKIENKYFYILGVRMREVEKEPEPKIELEDVFIGKRDFQSVFLATLKNTTAAIIKPLSIKYEIINKKNDKVMLSDKKTKMSMAPLSQFEFAIDLKDKKFKKGNYLLNMTAISSNKQWNFSKEFKINEDQIHEINGSTSIYKSNHLLLIIAVVLFILACAFLFIFFIKKY